FHHMPPAVARSILRDSHAKRKALCVFEISDNSQPNAIWWTAIPIGVLLTFFMTPLVRPLTLAQLALTYLFPVMPLMIAWDGAASNARTYTKNDLKAMIEEEGLTGEGYEWVVDTVKKPGVPGTMLYLLGIPR